ncbi:MAG: HD domain-containing protein [Gemmatimonadota bacterium]|nr:HD domain-containing protein [Gemmatimonadota bacterium]
MQTGDLDTAARHLEQEVEKRFPGGSRLRKHTRNVAELSRSVAERLGQAEAPPEAAYVAGLAHDLFKGWKHENLRELINREPVPIDRYSWRFGGALLHAPPAAHYLRQRLGIRDTDLLCAVYYHTTGRAGACLLERIVYCVDYLDPSRQARPDEPGLETLREQLFISGRPLIIVYFSLRPTISR